MGPHGRNGSPPVRILVVEDEALLAEELQVRLQRMAVEVVGIASSAEQAIALSASLTPDLVLMDVHLKGAIDGIDAASAIREWVHVPVVYLTAHSDDDTLQRARETSPFGYLIKPTNDRDLYVAITMALHKAKDERRLRHDKDDLVRSFVALQEFTSLASHDLRAPLCNITGLVDLIREDGPCTPDQEEGLRRIEGSASRMLTLLESLLDMARLQRPTFSSVDLNVTLEHVFADLQHRIADVGATVHVGTLPVIDADATQLHRLFLNLAANALKFHRPDVAPVVSVTMVPLDGAAAAADHVTIELRDNGVGFPPEQADRLFQPFRRLHGGRFEGTGLGLAACAKIVALHHGTISASSAGINGGAVLTVRLPTFQRTVTPKT